MEPLSQIILAGRQLNPTAGERYTIYVAILTEVTVA
jgi:hypothetical protein